MVPRLDADLNIIERILLFALKTFLNVSRITVSVMVNGETPCRYICCEMWKY